MKGQLLEGLPIPPNLLLDVMNLCRSLNCHSNLECAVHGTEKPVLYIAMLQNPPPSGQLGRAASTFVLQGPEESYKDV